MQASVVAEASAAPHVLATANVTHACLVGSGLRVTYLSAKASSGALGDLTPYVSAEDHAQLAFDRTAIRAQTIAKSWAHALRILNLWASTYTIRNVAGSWSHKP